MYGVIYKITCLVNGKIYIGKTIRDVEVRWKQHYYSKSIDHFYNAIRKYGKENFKIEILCYCQDKEELNNKEIELIAQFDCRNTEIGYNISPGGDGAGSGKDHPNFGKHHSDETKKKISEGISGENNPMFGRTGENNHLFEKPRSDETKNKISEALKGEKCYNYGKHLPDEVKQKMSLATKGENNPRAKLNWDDVNQIRDLYATGQFTLKQLAEKFLVNQTHISKIILNKAWVV